MKFNIEILKQYREDGKLISQTHPYHPLIIWNYTQKVQYEQLWDDITINCRGLVTDLDGNVISKGFSKFWNLEEGKHIPTKDFEIFEKLDGQYIGAFFYNGELIVNSRGSFTSQYAIAAHVILKNKYDVTLLPTGYTHCFELVGYEQIVVNYPEEDLILTACFDEFGRNEVDIYSKYYLENFKVAKKYSGLDYTKIKELNWENCEGFVVRFSNGSRCKVKFEEYCRLHYLMTNLSTTGIWEALSQGNPVTSILQDVPDEVFEKVRCFEHSLIEMFNSEIQLINLYYDFYKPLFLNSRKLFYKRIDEQLTNFYKSALLSKIDNKVDMLEKLIWMEIKPEFNKL